MNVSRLLHIGLKAASSAASGKANVAGVVCMHFQRCTVTESIDAAKPVAAIQPQLVRNVNECSPAYKLLQSVAQRKLATGATDGVQSPRSPLPKSTAVVSSTCAACWHAKHVHALSKWLAEQKCRYVYSDWERGGSIGDVCWSRSQRGHFRAYHQVFVRKYQCTSASSQLYLPVTVEQRRYIRSLASSTDLECGLKQQRRIYKCGPHMTLHMSTRCGRWYRIWVEIEIEQRDSSATATNDDCHGSLAMCKQLHTLLHRTLKHSLKKSATSVVSTY